MAKTIPTKEPAELTIGSSWAWDVTYPDFPADESWQLNYYLRGPKDITLAWGTHVTAGDGAEFEVRVTPAQQTTLGLTDQPGKYRLLGRASKSGDTWDGEIVYSAHLLVLPNPTTAVNAKSFNRQRLEELQAATLRPNGIREVAVNGGRTVYEPGEYDRELARYTYLVAIEENPNGRVMHEVEFCG